MDPGLHALHQVGPGREGRVIAPVPRSEATQPAMSENAPNGTPARDLAVVSGEIVEVAASYVRVRLDSGEIGTAPAGPELGALRAGDRATFRAVSADPGAALALAFVEGDHAAPTAEEPFDREVGRLHSALANHRPSAAVRSVERVHLGEEQIRTWIRRVEGRVDVLRKHRTKRSNEEFYNT